MKKVFLGLLTITALLLSSCGSDDTVAPASSEEGELVAKITFQQSAVLRASTSESAAIPITSWSNVKQIQMFLYNSTTGNVAFSAIFDPSTASDKIFKWTNVPEGQYDLALVANVNSSSDNIATTINGGAAWDRFDAYNVRGKILNTDIYLDWKPSDFPNESRTFEDTDMAFAPTSEVFTAYKSGVNIVRGATTDLSLDGALALEREVSLMRVRIDKTDKADSAPALSTVTFNSANSFIAVHNLPVGMGFKLGSFAGGLLTNSTNSNHILIGASGTNTYNDADPSETDYQPTNILGGGYTLWKDILVWPNVTKAQTASNQEINVSQKYFIVVSALAPANYKFADNTVSTVPQPVYWYGTINGAFTPNVIREVNLKLSSRGYPENPENPTYEGGLIIEVGAPQPWSIIERETIEL